MNEPEIKREESKAFLTLGKKLTAVEVPALQASLKRELAAGMKEIVFDLGKTESMDSTGIGLLVAANNSVSSVQGSVRMVNVSSDILKLLQSMRLVDRLHATAPGKD